MPFLRSYIFVVYSLRACNHEDIYNERREDIQLFPLWNSVGNIMTKEPSFTDHMQSKLRMSLSRAIFTAGQRNCGKVMFSRVSVCSQGIRYIWCHVPSWSLFPCFFPRGWLYPAPRISYPLHTLTLPLFPRKRNGTRNTLAPTRNHKSGWYASYWNACLFCVL